MTPVLAQRPRVDRAFERLYRRHVADVYHYALAVLRSAHDAEDVTQTTFLNAYRAYERGERPKAPRNWLIAIAHNVCRQRFRQSARRPEEVAFDEDVSLVPVEEESGPTAADIRRALGHLAFNQRAALVMRELEGRSYAEIASILDLSVSAVETLIFRARRALREQLEGALTCHEAEFAVSRQLDGRLPRSERPALRAHLRECSACATFARSQRAQRAAFKALGAVPVPASLASFFGGGTAAVGTGVAVKAAAVVVAGAIVGTAGYEGVHRLAPPANTLGAALVPPRAGAAPVAAGAESGSGSPLAAGPSIADEGREGAGGEKARATRPSRGKALGRPAAPPGQVKKKDRGGRADEAPPLRLPAKARPARGSNARRGSQAKKAKVKPAKPQKPPKSSSDDAGAEGGAPPPARGSGKVPVEPPALPGVPPPPLPAPITLP